jgi:hypothetical protein
VGDAEGVSEGFAVTVTVGAGEGAPDSDGFAVTVTVGAGVGSGRLAQ